MKATEAKLLTFLKNAPQFIIPIYQRTYSWTDKECRQLWDDIVRAGRHGIAKRLHRVTTEPSVFRVVRRLVSRNVSSAPRLPKWL